MNSRSKIVGLTRQSSDDTEVTGHEYAVNSLGVEESQLFTDNSTEFAGPEYHEDDIDVGRHWSAFITPILLIFALFAWSGFFVWTYFREASAGLSGERIVTLIGMWTLPALLLAVVWLLFMRSSRAEANRFGDAAKLLRVESEALEKRMRTVNEEISLAREFLAQNARELETIGRQSAKNLVEAAQQLGAALADSDEKAKTLENVSNAATSNLDQLRKHLPVVTSAAKDVTNQIGSAGNSAQMHVKSLIASLQRVGEAGKETREYIDHMEARSVKASDQLAEIIKQSAIILAETTGSAEARTIEMAAVLSDATAKMTGRITEASQEVDRFVAESGSNLDGHLGILRSGIERLSVQSASEEIRIGRILSKISTHIEESATRITDVDLMATDQTAKLAFAVCALGESTREVGVALNLNQDATDELLARSNRLLAALSAANREIDENLPAAVDRMGERFEATVRQLQLASTSAKDLDASSDSLLSKITSLEHLIDTQRNGVSRLMAVSDEHFAARHEQADALAAALNQIRALVEDMSEIAGDKLVNSLLRVRETTKQAAESSRKILDEELAYVADQLSEQNKVALANAVDDQIKAINGQIQEAIERNFSMSATATQAVTAQLAEIDEMTSNLEKRVAATRDGFEGIDDDSFARQMVLLTESLNSTAIDVAKILSNEVTDTSWAAYLKGDRGVFTRRAVRLLEAGEARAIADHYGEDAEFREHVNRYIHDFEGMMRVLLSTRDGNAIGVTLLSSDVGKLYVALAQAIERLRN